MKSILDIGRTGSERLDSGIAIAPGASIDQITQLASVLKKFPRQTIPAEMDDGVRHEVGVRSLQLKSRQVFQLLHSASLLEPLVYVRFQGRQAMGMLSPNFDIKGISRLASLKVIPLQVPYPLTRAQKPDARMATMLAGAVSGERKGVGAHHGKVSNDFEHRATILGAVSLGRPEVALGHKNHAVRQASSLATGLTNGALGNLYARDPSVSDFTGFGKPVTIDEAAVGSDDFIFIPDSFLDGTEAYGISYGDAPRILLGAGLEALYQRKGQQAGSAQIHSLTERLA